MRHRSANCCFGVFILFFFSCDCLGSKRERVSVDLDLPIGPRISTLYSTVHSVPQHLIFMTRAPQTFLAPKSLRKSVPYISQKEGRGRKGEVWRERECGEEKGVRKGSVERKGACGEERGVWRGKGIKREQEEKRWVRRRAWEWEVCF